jgi:hypothetical protein
MSIAFDETLIRADEYNRLPHVDDVSSVPDEYYKDRDELRALLAKHDLPDWVSVRLIHKHFDAHDGEIMVFRAVSVPAAGDIRIMGPMKCAASAVRGFNYRVGNDKRFYPYEYTSIDIPSIDTSKYEFFFEEFADLVVERKMQEKWGLKIGFPGDHKNWNEFEFGSRRSTFMIPDGRFINIQPARVVVTDWHADERQRDKCLVTRSGNHYGCSTTRSGKHYQAAGEGGSYYFAGQKVETGTPLHEILRSVEIAAC